MTADPDPAEAEALPDRIGPYAVEGVLGRGGMGVVYAARGPAGEPVAVKVLRAGRRQAVELRSRFELEGRLRIDHPNVVQTLDAGADDETLWIALERLTGETLGERLEATRRLEIHEVLRIGRQVAAGLGAAHADSVVHRDLKPSNIFLSDDGSVKVLDFGIARLTDRDTRLTATGHMVGTAAYLSPEQARGDADVDPRADVWALGVVLYEGLAGRHPFERGTVMATMLAILAEEPAPLSTLRGDVSAGLAAVVMRCLERDPRRRFPDASALAEALATLRPDEPSLDLEVTDATALSQPLGGAIAPGERRVVVVMLAEGVRDAAEVAGAVRARGGAFVPLGDRALGLFGGTRWDGDEMERAALAAVAARGSARAVAVASGRASYSGSTGIAGSVLEAAEAGCRARRGGVALDESTARALSTLFAVSWDEAGGELVERPSRPIHETSGSGHTLTPPSHGVTVGREAELAQLRRAALTLDEEGEAVAVLVIGPPGAGKSHLRWAMGEILERESLEKPLVLSARVAPLHREVAFQLFRELLRSRAWLGHEQEGWPSPDPLASPGERRASAAAVAAEVGIDPDLVADLVGAPAERTDRMSASRADPRLVADRLRLTLTDWLSALADMRPVALLLDDLQWADAASLELLDDLTGMLSEAPLLVLACARPELLETRAELFGGILAARIEPRPLLASEVEQLAESLLGVPLPPGLGRRLAERSGGNPLFVEQLVRALDLGSIGDVEALPLPLTVEAAVQSRLDHLPQAEKELCKRASVLERPVTPEELEVLGVLDPRPRLAALVRRELLAVRGRARGLRRYRFHNPLVREVAYGMLGPGLPEELHGRMANHLAASAEPDAEEVARHLERALRGYEAARWYARAAESASRSGDPAAVIRCAERALWLEVDDETAASLHPLRSEAHEVLGDLDRQGEALEAALATVREPAERARVRTDHAVWQWRRGRPDDAVGTATEAIDEARRAGDPEALALALGRYGVIQTYRGSLDEAAGAIAEATPLAEGLGASMRGHAASWRAQLANARGDHAARRAAYRVAVDRYTEAGDLRRACGAELNLADAANRVGAYREADAALETARAKAARVGNRLWEGYASVNQAYARLLLGRLPEAEEALARAERRAVTTGEARLSVAAKLYRARLALARAEPEAALALAREAVAAAHDHRLPGLEALARAALARAHLELGDLEGAEQEAGLALDARDALGSLEEDEGEVFLTRIRALEAQGRHLEAETIRTRARSRLRALADLIADPELRARFIEDVPAHRELMSG